MAATAETSWCFYNYSQDWVIKDPREVIYISCASKGVLSSPEVEMYLPGRSSADIKESDKVENGSVNKLVWKMELNVVRAYEVIPDIYYRFSISSKSDRLSRGIGVHCHLTARSNNAIICDLDPIPVWLKPGETVDRVLFRPSFLFSKVTTSDLKLSCTCKVYDTSVPTRYITPSHVPAAYSDELSQALDKDRMEGICTDTILKYGDKEFKVHKNVLSLQSEFFKARFSDRWDGTDGSNVVNMNDSDLDLELLEALVSGAYTGTVSDSDMALKLLPVVDKYQFPRLKSVCEAMIASQLRLDNVLARFMLARQHGAQDLQRKCEELLKMYNFANM